MANVVTISAAEGSFTIDAELLKAGMQRYFEAADAKAAATQDEKDEIEGVADSAQSTTMEAKVIKKILGKYFKARYKEQTKEAKELGEMFGALDNAVA